MTEPGKKGYGLVPEPTEEQRQKAARTVAQHARDKTECREFLNMLGYETKDEEEDK